MKAEEKGKQGSKATQTSWHFTSMHPVLTDEERKKHYAEIRRAMIRFMIADESKKARLAREKLNAEE